MITHVDLMAHMGQKSSTISKKKGGPEAIEKSAPEPAPSAEEKTEAPVNADAGKGDGRKPDFTNWFAKKPEKSEEETLNDTIDRESAQAFGAGEISVKTRSAARLTARMTDTAFSTGLKLYAGAESNKKFKATSDEFDELVEAFAEYFHSTNTPDIPPGIVLLFTIFLIYSSKFGEAHQMRKDLKKAKEMAKSKEESDDFIEEVDAEEVPNSQLDFRALGIKLNQEARLAGAPEMERFDKAPDGMCRYYWHYEGRQVSATRGRFADQQAQSKWGTIMSVYRRAEIEYSWIQEL